MDRVIVSRRQHLELRERKAQACPDASVVVRWAKAGAILSPGIVFSAIVGERIYSYSATPTGRIREV